MLNLILSYSNIAWDLWVPMQNYELVMSYGTWPSKIIDVWGSITQPKDRRRENLFYVPVTGPDQK